MPRKTLQSKILNAEKFTASIKNYTDELRAELRAIVERHLNTVADRARATAPRSGARRKRGQKPLADSITVEMYPIFAGGCVRVNAPHAEMVEFGTKPHRIQVSAGKRVMSRDRQVYGRRVMHPGAQARPFFIPAQQGIAGSFNDEVSRAIDRLGSQ